MAIRISNKKPAGKDLVVLQNIQPRVDFSRIMNRLRFTAGGQLSQTRIREILERVLLATAARALYQISRITVKTKNGLDLDGVQFSYPLLRVNLNKASQIFPFCVTTGDPIQAIPGPPGEPHESYCLKIIQQLVLDETVKSLQNHLTQKYHLPYIWSMIPGDMQAWPLSGQKELFEVMGDAPQAIGVKLQPDFSLLPVYSRSGLFYFAETVFEGCQVCSREPCMMRRAQYNAELAAQKGLKIGKVCGQDTA
jgi:hypothetical protein